MKKAIGFFILFILFFQFQLVMAGPSPEIKRESDELLRKTDPAKVQKMLDAANRFIDEYRKPENERKRRLFFREVDSLVKNNYQNEQVEKVTKMHKEIEDILMSYASSRNFCKDPLQKFYFNKSDIHLFYGDSVLLCKTLPPINLNQKFRRYCLTVEKVGDKYKCRFFNFSNHDIP